MRMVVELGWPNEVILNINLPARPARESAAVEVTRQGFRDAMTGLAADGPPPVLEAVA
jgi:broad specificity polyphosphatase/5'/3'-nucleotidase SurE